MGAGKWAPAPERSLAFRTWKLPHVEYYVVLLAMVLPLVGTVLAAPAQLPARPTWIDDPAASFPSAEFLVGVGDGDSTEAAVENARGDLAAAFRARVRSVKQVDDDVAETFGREGATLDRSTRTRRSTEVEANENLANIVLGGTWFDESSGRYHALVFIKRMEAEQTIGADIHNCLLRIGELLDCNGCYADAVAEYGGAAKALTLYREYEELNAQLRVVSEGRAGVIDAGLGSRVALWFADTGSRLTLKIVSAPANLEPSLRDVLSQAGFIVVVGPTLFTAELVYATHPTTYKDPFVFELWEMSLRIRRAVDGTEVVTLNKHDRAGHKSREAAQERCLREARKVLIEEFGFELEAFLTSQR